MVIDIPETVEEFARQLAGNWKGFHAFAWSYRYELPDPDHWAIIYTHNRDSDILAESNADAIKAQLQPYADADPPDVIFESHRHWAYGHVDGFSVRVFRADGSITEAFRRYHELARRLADYPVLDEEDFSRREYEATLENIGDAGRSLRGRTDLPDGWETAVYSWLSEHDQRAVESVDGRGGYPSDDSLREAFKALGYLPAEE